MLGDDYTIRFNQLVEAIVWTIVLPDSWAGFFNERGHSLSFDGDQRRHRRFKARARGVMYIERSLPTLDRTLQGNDRPLPAGIYSCDFSQRSCGFVAPFQLYPEERLRILLPTFWMTVKTQRCNRVGRRCYSVGTTLTRQHEPCLEAFELEAFELPAMRPLPSDGASRFLQQGPAEPARFATP